MNSIDLKKYSSFVNKTDFVNLITARSDYKTRAEREQDAKGE